MKICLVKIHFQKSNLSALKTNTVKFKNTNLYICEIVEESFEINVNDKILYKIEDIIIYDNKEYLEAKI